MTLLGTVNPPVLFAGKRLHFNPDSASFVLRDAHSAVIVDPDFLCERVRDLLEIDRPTATLRISARYMRPDNAVEVLELRTKR